MDVLYGSNLGCDIPDDIFEITTHLLHFEQKFVTWQRSLPALLSLIGPETFSAGEGNQDTLRFRFILTLRFLNLRILTHRPLLCKYLELLGTGQFESPQLSLLKQVGVNSVRVCIQSALEIIELMRRALNPTESLEHLLGAWWFSLYYSK